MNKEMKRIGLILCVLLIAATTKADDLYLHTWDVTIGKARTATLYIGMDDEVERWHGFSMDISLPKGITMKCDDDDNPIFTMLARMQGRSSGMSNYQETKDLWSFAFTQTTMSGIRVGTDPLFSVTLIAADDVADGTYTGKITNVVFATLEDQAEYPKDAEFTITVDHTKLETVTLDETSTTAPTASDGEVNVQVKRTIKGGEWSTLCLPFAMTGEQVTNVFGSDVQLADYSGWEGTYASDDDENPSHITVSFTSVQASDGLKVNHPYVIKTSADISEFSLEAVTISPESEPAVTTGSARRGTLGSFIGNYVADFTVPEKTLFLDEGQFWYSAGKTKMKAFRAYFDLSGVLQSYFDGTTNAKIDISLDGATGIGKISNDNADNSTVYSLEGTVVSRQGTAGLPQGVYIVGGKKVIVK